MAEPHLEIRDDGVRQELHIDGSDVSGHVYAYTVTGRAGHLPQVTLNLEIVNARFEGANIRIDIDPTMSALLVKAGWTPPDDPGAADRP